jgi:hypothetical protein
MGGGLIRRIPPARLYLGATVLIGLLVAVVTVAQMASLSEIVGPDPPERTGEGSGEDENGARAEAPARGKVYTGAIRARSAGPSGGGSRPWHGQPEHIGPSV